MGEKRGVRGEKRRRKRGGDEQEGQRAKMRQAEEQRVQGGVGRCGEAFRARGRAGMDVLRRLERRAHNLLAAVCLKAITMTYVELCEV